MAMKGKLWTISSVFFFSHSFVLSTLLMWDAVEIDNTQTRHTMSDQNNLKGSYPIYEILSSKLIIFPQEVMTGQQAR